MNGLLNTLRASLRGRNASVILKKALRRMTVRDDRTASRQWAMDQARSVADFCRDTDPTLWEETRAFASDMQKYSLEKLRTTEFAFGGGGAYPLLYFLVRKLAPQTIVETGVAAGWSSETILSACDKNGAGTLYSSDFPYFRLKDPHQFIGLLVSDNHRPKWKLDIRGDEMALPEIVKQVTKIDFVHYDSDKSYEGRRFALTCLLPKMHDHACFVMDDIQDNTFFRDLVSNQQLDYDVLEFESKFIGLIRNAGSALRTRMAAA